MADELRGVEIRLERAHEHVDTLKHEARMFMMEPTQPYGSAIDDKPVGGEYIVRARVFRRPPVRLGAIAADAAHNLRAALDMIVWQLALVGPNPPGDDDRATGFPLCTSQKAWESPRTQRMVERISPYARQIIKSFQPYHDRGPDDARLAILQGVDNWAKHHDIPVTMGFLVSRIRPLSRYEVTSFEQRVFDDGDEICRVRYTGPSDQPKDHFQSLMKCHVAFAKGSPTYGYPIDFLENAIEQVRDHIVPAFEGFFVGK